MARTCDGLTLRKHSPYEILVPAQTRFLRFQDCRYGSRQFTRIGRCWADAAPGSLIRAPRTRKCSTRAALVRRRRLPSDSIAGPRAPPSRLDTATSLPFIDQTAAAMWRELRAAPHIRIKLPPATDEPDVRAYAGVWPTQVRISRLNDRPFGLANRDLSPLRCADFSRDGEQEARNTRTGKEF
jgi:hypothetical protein